MRAFVEEQTADEKTIVFKYKKRKNYARKHGHRRKLTSLRVVAIEGAGAYLPTASYSAEMAAAMSAASIADFAPKGVHGATAEQDQEWEDAQASAGGDEEEGGEGEDDEGLEEGEAAPPPPAQVQQLLSPPPPSPPAPAGSPLAAPAPRHSPTHSAAAAARAAPRASASAACA